MYKVWLMFYVYMMILLLLSIFWMFWALTKAYTLSREKSSSFECGFDPKDSSRLPFSLRFFVMIMLFIVFDMELCMLMKMPFQFLGGMYYSFAGYFIFLFIMSMGTFEEWRRGVLSWKLA